MSHSYKSPLLVVVLLLALTSPLAAFRDVLPPLAVRLAAAAATHGQGEGILGCLQAMKELRSCTAEIILFFLDGESYLTLDCCRAIRVITHSCWPTMLSALGFTAEEADVLRGYCDAEVTAPPTPTGAPPSAVSLPPSATTGL